MGTPQILAKIDEVLKAIESASDGNARLVSGIKSLSAQLKTDAAGMGDRVEQIRSAGTKRTVFLAVWILACVAGAVAAMKYLLA